MPAASSPSPAKPIGRGYFGSAGGAPLAIGGAGVSSLVPALAPLAILVWTSLMPFQAPLSVAAARMATLANHREFFANPFIAAATANSLVIALSASTAVAALSLVTAWASSKGRAPGRRGLR